MILPRLAAVFLFALGDLFAADYPGNRAPLLPAPYLPLPLGSVRAQGWLLTQLELQRDGLTGHLPELMPAVGPDNGWLGGNGENWEKGPYYVRGLLALAYTLDDAKLKSAAQKWVDWSLGSQRSDGFFGPKSNDDWWPRMVMAHILREYADATADPRVEPFLTKYYAYMLKTLPHRPLKDWGKSRAGDELETVLWLYNRTGERSLLDLAKLLHDQAYPWVRIFTANEFLEFGGDFQPKHNVNVPQALKLPALWYQVSRSKQDAAAVEAGFANLGRDHGLSFGISGGTEMLAGRSTTQGVETCSIVEKMLSDEIAVRILGDPMLGDNLETLAFNALPAALTKDIKQQVYYTLPNNVRAVTGSFGFNQDYSNGTTPGVPSGFPCCIYNFHMGWPKFAQNSWAATSDGGLAIMAYAPTKVTAKVGSAEPATIDEQTDYPFGARISLKISVPQAVVFPLDLRIPGWCSEPSVLVNGVPVAGAKAGEFLRIARPWNSGDLVELHFPMHTRLVMGVNNSVSVLRGPLLYSLRIAEDWKVKEPKGDGFGTFEVEPKSPWNYGLVLGENVDSSFALKVGPMPENPFEPATAPVLLKVAAKQIPTWTMAWNQQVAFDPPVSPVKGAGPVQEIELVPAGSQMLRVTNFPLIGDPAPAVGELHPDFAKEGLSRWIPYGGGWFVQDGVLHDALNNGAGHPGSKAVDNESDFSDFVYEADVNTGDKGQAGLIFRVGKPAIGADAYTGYYVGLNSEDGQVMIGKADGNWTQLGSAKTSIGAGQSHHFRIVAKGSKIEVYFDKSPDPLLAIEDATFARGSVGVRQYSTEDSETPASFANIDVKAL